MWNSRFDRDRSARTDRWKREDAARRLVDEVPTLQTLVLSLRDVRESNAVSGSDRKQHVIVSRAAALFEITCAEPKCEEGGHDLTADMLSNLRHCKPQFSGTSECRGMVGNGGCRRTLHFSALATYKG
jgi:hypothetical protein